MKIIENNEFDALILQKVKAGMRKHVEKTSTRYFGGGNAALSVIYGMKMVADIADSDGPDILISKVAGPVFCFSLREKSLEDWTQKIQQLSMSTPRKLVVHMLYSRIKELEASHNNFLDLFLKSSEDTELLMKFPELITRIAFDEYNKGMKEFYNWAMPKRPRETSHLHAVIVKNFNKIQKVLDREDVNDNIIIEAWNLVVADTVMES